MVFGVCAVVAAIASVVGRPPARPNIVLLTLDTTRADHLATYGYFRETTPNLDKLAKDAVVFDRFLVPMATTLPTHSSMFTGAWPLEHGITANVKHGGRRFKPSPALRSVTELLSDEGYRTAAFVSATPLQKGTGMESGFDVYDAPDNAQRKGAKTIHAAKKWVRKKAREKGPFFLWVHLYDPHGPYTPPMGYDRRWLPDEAQKAWLAERGTTLLSARPTGQELDALSDGGKYDGELSYMDHFIGNLIEELRDAWVLRRTAIVVAGDHGEGLGQHGVAGHGQVWGEQLHAPFFVWTPWHHHRRVAAPSTAVDVFPTVFGMLGMDVGATLASQASGMDARHAPRDRPLLHLSSARQASFGNDDVVALTKGGWRYHRQGDVERLYDLQQDPFELQDLADREPGRVAVLREITDDMVREQSQRGAELGTGEEVQLSAEELRQLEELGYVE